MKPIENHIEKNEIFPPIFENLFQVQQVQIQQPAQPQQQQQQQHQQSQTTQVFQQIVTPSGEVQNVPVSTRHQVHNCIVTINESQIMAGSNIFIYCSQYRNTRP